MRGVIVSGSAEAVTVVTLHILPIYWAIGDYQLTLPAHAELKACFLIMARESKRRWRVVSLR